MKDIRPWPIGLREGLGRQRRRGFHTGLRGSPKSKWDRKEEKLKLRKKRRFNPPFPRLAGHRHFRKTTMDVMDYFSDRAVTFYSDGATELDASFLSFPRSAGPKVKPLFSIPQKRRRSAFYTLIHKKSYLPHTEESIRDGPTPGRTYTRYTTTTEARRM